MFAESFLAISLAEIIGFVITIVSVGLIVRQLNDTRLASYSEIVLSLLENGRQIVPDRVAIGNVVSDESFQKLSTEQQYEMVWGDDSLKIATINVLHYYETIGTLVKTRGLAKSVAEETFGEVVSVVWTTFEPIVRNYRRSPGNERVGENWEWLANEFEISKG